MVRALEEKVTLTRQVAEQMKQRSRLSASATLEEHADKLDEEVSLVRNLILNGSATKRDVVVDDEDKD